MCTWFSLDTRTDRSLRTSFSNFWDGLDDEVTTDWPAVGPCFKSLTHSLLAHVLVSITDAHVMFALAMAGVGFINDDLV
jgi:hypothetical protein